MTHFREWPDRTYIGPAGAEQFVTEWLEIWKDFETDLETLQGAVKYRGSSLADEGYVDLFGKPGEYQDHHQVYGREGESCNRCRRPIHRARYSNRSTFYCDACQV